MTKSFFPFLCREWRRVGWAPFWLGRRSWWLRTVVRWSIQVRRISATKKIYEKVKWSQQSSLNTVWKKHSLKCCTFISTSCSAASLLMWTGHIQNNETVMCNTRVGHKHNCTIEVKEPNWRKERCLCAHFILPCFGVRLWYDTIIVSLHRIHTTSSINNNNHKDFTSFAIISVIKKVAPSVALLSSFIMAAKQNVVVIMLVLLRQPGY